MGRQNYVLLVAISQHVLTLSTYILCGKAQQPVELKRDRGVERFQIVNRFPDIFGVFRS